MNDFNQLVTITDLCRMQAMDTDSTDDHVMLNRIVSLKEDPTKSRKDAA